MTILCGERQDCHPTCYLSRAIKAHLASIYNKLGVDSRAAAIAVAAQKGRMHD